MADNQRRSRRQRNPYQGVGIFIAFALIIVFIASFWQVIIGCLIGAFIVYVVWRFREEICRGIAAVFRFVLLFFSWSFHNIATAYAKVQEKHKIENTTKPEKLVDDSRIKRS